MGFKIHKPDASYLYKEAKDCVNVKPDSSIPYVMLSIFVVKMLYIIKASAEVPIPSAVLYKASEIPTARAVASPPPEALMQRKNGSFLLPYLTRQPMYLPM
jgi:hypothetical protein